MILIILLGRVRGSRARFAGRDGGAARGHQSAHLRHLESRPPHKAGHDPHNKVTTLREQVTAPAQAGRDPHAKSRDPQVRRSRPRMTLTKSRPRMPQSRPQRNAHTRPLRPFPPSHPPFARCNVSTLSYPPLATFPPSSACARTCTDAGAGRGGQIGSVQAFTFTATRCVAKMKGGGGGMAGDGRRDGGMSEEAREGAHRA